MKTTHTYHATKIITKATTPTEIREALKGAVLMGLLRDADPVGRNITVRGDFETDKGVDVFFGVDHRVLKLGRVYVTAMVDGKAEKIKPCRDGGGGTITLTIETK